MDFRTDFYKAWPGTVFLQRQVRDKTAGTALLETIRCTYTGKGVVALTHIPRTELADGVPSLGYTLLAESVRHNRVVFV